MKLYNTLIYLSRNIFFYKEINLPDTFETRINLIFFHFSIMLIVTKNKNEKFDQILYDDLFHNIENNLRELGLGDVSVNKKMKEFNRILYDILLKINSSENKNEKFDINYNLVSKYFSDLSEINGIKFILFKKYFLKFYKFCFELSIKNMVREAQNYKFIN